MAQVGSHQQGALVIPLNGTSPVDADEVRLNDNAIATTYNAHDADATLHVQSSLLVSRPAVGAAAIGALWFTTDEQKLYYNTGTVWQELKLTGSQISGGTIPSSVLPVVPVDKGGTGVSSAPAAGYLLIGNGTGFTLAQIAAGPNMIVTNGAGAITLEATLAGGAIGGSGTTGYVPRFTGTTTIGSGVMRDDGSYVGINTAPTAAYRLDVGGAARATSLDTTTFTATTATAGTLVATTTTFNSVPYTWPSVTGTAYAQLQTNGTGGLQWVPQAGGLNLINQQTYGGF